MKPGPFRDLIWCIARLPAPQAGRPLNCVSGATRGARHVAGLRAGRRGRCRALAADDIARGDRIGIPRPDMLSNGNTCRWAPCASEPSRSASSAGYRLMTNLQASCTDSISRPSASKDARDPERPFPPTCELAQGGRIFRGVVSREAPSIAVRDIC